MKILKHEIYISECSKNQPHIALTTRKPKGLFCILLHCILIMESAKCFNLVIMLEDLPQTKNASSDSF